MDEGGHEGWVVGANKSRSGRIYLNAIGFVADSDNLLPRYFGGDGRTFPARGVSP